MKIFNKIYYYIKEMNRTFKKNRKPHKNKSRYIKKYKKTHNTRDRIRKSTGHHKYHKHHKNHKSHKHMKGGAALFFNQPSATSSSNSVSYNIGGPKGTAIDTYVKNTDKPSGPVSFVNFTPQPLLNAFWSAQSGIKNFFNDILGQPKQLTSSPTDQPIGKTINPYTPTQVTSQQLNTTKNAIINKFS